MTHRIWFERHFDLGLPPEAFPEIVERIRGTPARLEERLLGIPEPTLTRRPGEAWTIKEQVGHLGDLEPLWAGRLDDLLAGAKRLRPADLTNRATHEAAHDRAPLDALLGRFREYRQAVTARLDALDAAALGRTGLHPRLEQPMSVVDLFYFVAEHDDHHLARISALLRAPRD